MGVGKGKGKGKRNETTECGGKWKNESPVMTGDGFWSLIDADAETKKKNLRATSTGICR